MNDDYLQAEYIFTETVRPKSSKTISFQGNKEFLKWDLNIKHNIFKQMLYQLNHCGYLADWDESRQHKDNCFNFT